MPIKKVLKKEKTEKKPIKKVVKKITKKKTTVNHKTLRKAVPKKKALASKAIKSVNKAKIQTKSAKQSIVIWATGKRKTAIARVKFYSDGSGDVFINKKPLASCSLVPGLRKIILEPLVLLKREKDFSIKANVKGGGIKSQAEAVRLGITRALVIFNPEWRKELKSEGFLRRDPRKKERKKPGLKRARRAPQWSKR